MKRRLLLCPVKNSAENLPCCHVLKILLLIGSTVYVASFTGRLDKPSNRRRLLCSCKAYVYN